VRREDANAVILGLAKEAVTIKEIVRRTEHSRGLVRKVLRGQRSDVFRVRESSLELHLQWQRNATELWRRLKRQRGFAAAFGLSVSGPHAAVRRRRSTAAS
jgi:hypothetical protein